MAIPFRDLGEDRPGGLAGFLRFIEEPGGQALRGALFLMTAAGEPHEFCFTRADSAPSLLWRPGDRARTAVASLCRELFRACLGRPDVLLGLADEISPRVFTEDIGVAIPLGRLSRGPVASEAVSETLEALDGGVSLAWVNGPPPEGSVAREMVSSLAGHGLLFEPFERAARGMEEGFAHA